MVREEFINAVRIGKEIEFSCDRNSYFVSRKNDVKWYIYNEGNKTREYFKSADDLINNALINGIPLDEMWRNIEIDYIL